VSFGDEITPEASRRVRALLGCLQADPVPGTRNLHPAYCSLLIKFDPCLATHAQVERGVRERLARAGALPPAAPRRVEVPVCYDEGFGPDLASLAESQHLKVDDVIRIHSQQTYTVFFLGFAPGFAYLGMVPEAIAVPRLAVPRRRVDCGSVGIAGQQTGIYPCPVPAGWQIIGRTPLAMFRADREPMALLAAGDEVRFRPIGPEEFVRIEKGGA
jgi:KipI family sensor histidine kinase inhibitor